MQRKERFEKFLDYFSTHSPEPETELVYSNPYELLVAVSLSAQCTDKRVNLTTPALSMSASQVSTKAASSNSLCFIMDGAS